ncbi:monovalent cation/H(+) antiporter subunit G [Salisediminibacterium beveridgei]|uniref:Na(+) H(+) antiporter subunit G n=1 Tax=Salisediminibacterium beveridgei TaxID=632773 RepID=A0A1D7QU56_9BACI|nr:Na(+) H(+) antiporter subunit G [Salisediminibacterium beveridgei]
MTEIVISIFLLVGASLSLLGAIGIVRFPDVYGRLHAATKSATLGVISIISGVFLYFLWIDGIVVGKLLLTIIFVFLTAPVAAFMIGRSAYNTGVKMWGNTQQDDLADAMRKQKKENQQ